MADPILVVVDDLIFLAKIRETARLLNVPTAFASPAELPAKLAAASFATVILDLNHQSGKSLDALRAVKQDPRTQSVFVVGFVSHVQGGLVGAARKAGCDVVMARSAFSRDLPEILARAVKRESVRAE